MDYLKFLEQIPLFWMDLLPPDHPDMMATVSEYNTKNQNGGIPDAVSQNPYTSIPYIAWFAGTILLAVILRKRGVRPVWAAAVPTVLFFLGSLLFYWLNGS